MIVDILEPFTQIICLGAVLDTSDIQADEPSQAGNKVREKGNV